MITIHRDIGPLKSGSIDASLTPITILTGVSGSGKTLILENLWQRYVPNITSPLVSSVDILLFMSDTGVCHSKFMKLTKSRSSAAAEDWFGGAKPTRLRQIIRDLMSMLGHAEFKIDLHTPMVEKKWFTFIWALLEGIERFSEQDKIPSVTILFDGLENFCHPSRQRQDFRGIEQIITTLVAKKLITSVNFILSTNSPITLTQAVQSKNTTIYNLKNGKATVLHKYPYSSMDDWLMGDLFNFKFPCSLEAEAALTSALEYLRTYPEIKKLTLKELKIAKQRFAETDGELRKVLSDIDRFWIRWAYYGEVNKFPPYAESNVVKIAKKKR